MSVSDADIAFAMELFAPIGALTKRKMFGGLGIYHDGAIFALCDSEGQIYLKAQPPVSDELKGDGSSQFHNMPYWTLPDSALDDPEVACALARRCIATL